MTDTAMTDTAHIEAHGLSDLGYVKVAIFLAVITAIEVGISYMVDDLGTLFLPLLLGLMLLKFFMVILYFMHLKFDSKLFSMMFYIGLGLAVGVYGVALMTFKFFNG
jgi:cytochrome c oxidase subunit 4